jgi:hypothetical protein
MVEVLQQAKKPQKYKGGGKSKLCLECMVSYDYENVRGIVLGLEYLAQRGHHHAH